MICGGELISLDGCVEVFVGVGDWIVIEILGGGGWGEFSGYYGSGVMDEFEKR